MPRRFFGLLLSLTLALPGCAKKTAEKPAVAAPRAPRAAVKLSVVVVDDPGLAVGINLLRGEWAERSSGELEVREWSLRELLEAEELSCDLIVYPTRYLGTLVEQKSLRPVRKSVLEDKQFRFQEVLPLVRDRAMRYGGEIFGLSLGEPPLMLASKGESPLRFPQGSSLIVRAATYSDLQADSALLFDPQTMEPRLSEPPFERALRELVALDQEETTAKLSWPTAASEASKTDSMQSFTAIPRADQVYDRSLKTWSSGEEIGPSPTFLGFSGRLASVTSSSRNAVSAFKLLKWLASGETAIQVSQRSTATIWFRASQTSQSTKWLGGQNASDATSQAVTKLLSRKNAYVLPRIPGIDEYLESLDQVVAEVLLGNLDEEGALHEATTRWQAITESYGKQSQRAAYRRHLGFDDP
ncbi:MAG: hypothetical protein GXP28_11605 [Planctomycetes bacterium]|nr:hypothetical protein [Planctomycetota bacterium]